MGKYRPNTNKCNCKYNAQGLSLEQIKAINRGEAGKRPKTISIQIYIFKLRCVFTTKKETKYESVSTFLKDLLTLNT